MLETAHGFSTSSGSRPGDITPPAIAQHEPYGSLTSLPEHVLLQQIIPKISTWDKRYLRRVSRPLRSVLDKCFTRLSLSAIDVQCINHDIAVRFPHVSSLSFHDSPALLFDDHLLSASLAVCTWKGICLVDLQHCFRLSPRVIPLLVQACPCLKSFRPPLRAADPYLHSLSPLSSLRELNLGNSHQDSFSVSNSGLSSLTPLVHLTHLSLERCQSVTDPGLEALGRLLNLGNLDLSGTRVTAQGLAWLSGCKQLVSLRLNGCRGVSDEGLEAVGNLRMLTRLELDNSAFTNQGLFSLLLLPHLACLSLGSHCTLQDSGFQNIGHITTLTQLRFGSISITSCLPSSFPSLRHLEFGGIYQNLGIEHLFPFQSVTCLVLQGLDTVTNAALRHAALQVGLTSIKLSGGYRLTDDGLTQLTQLTMLRSIELNACPQLTKEGLKQVASVNQCLTRLAISRCPRLADDALELKMVMPVTPAIHVQP